MSLTRGWLIMKFPLFLLTMLVLVACIACGPKKIQATPHAPSDRWPSATDRMLNHMDNEPC